jgi:deoxyhypusine synthase
MAAFATTGFQATHLAAAADEVNRMLSWRASDDPAYAAAAREAGLNPDDVDCKIFLAFTSNLGSSGVRDVIAHLLSRRLVDVVVTTAGAVEEDLIKCLAPTYVGDFGLAGAPLRARGLNRIGNMLVPNSNYCAFEDWVMPRLDAALDKQEATGEVWTPSTLIAELGAAMDDDASFCTQAARHAVPVFCPALTDGSLGDMLYFHSYKRPGLVLDIVRDVRAVNDAALKASPRATGVIVLGGGLPKHHVCNANLMRNGADFAVYVSTAQEFDGSDSGARPDEAVSWGKIKPTATPVKVHADATIAFPLLVAATFAKVGAGQRRHAAGSYKKSGAK